MIVVVDDERTLPGGDVHCRSSVEALALLASRPAVVQLWLDHDLGGDDTTRPVADELVRAAHDGCPYPVEQVVVHTANPVGRDWLVSYLRRFYPVVIRPAGSVAGFVPDPDIVAARDEQ